MLSATTVSVDDRLVIALIYESQCGVASVDGGCGKSCADRNSATSIFKRVDREEQQAEGMSLSLENETTIILIRKP